jgi:hypothetical protein
MTGIDRPGVTIVNPLTNTLAHYEGELIETLSHCGFADIEISNSVAGDAVRSALDRISVGLSTLRERFRLARSSGRIVIVIWPLFGFLEPVTLMRLARRNRVYIILHDPSPLRKQYGQSVMFARLFRAIVGNLQMRVLYHTVDAQRVGAQTLGVVGEVVPHPVRTPPNGFNRVGVSANRQPVIRVLGQYKYTRSVGALAQIAERANGEFELEIYGRDWPQVSGWRVIDRFVEESEFTALLRTADCVVIPYDKFFQSGVAVRCLEAGVPIVAPQHEHIVQLYGDDWLGIVRGASDWYSAIKRVLDLDGEALQRRQSEVVRAIRSAWKAVLTESNVDRSEAFRESP